CVCINANGCHSPAICYGRGERISKLNIPNAEVIAFFNIERIGSVVLSSANIGRRVCIGSIFSMPAIFIEVACEVLSAEARTKRGIVNLDPGYTLEVKGQIKTFEPPICV